MGQPVTTPTISRELVRFIPFAAQKTFRNAALGAGATMVWEFDVGLGITDRNQFLSAATAPTNSTSAPQLAVGPNLDAAAFSVAQPGTILVEYAIDVTCAYRVVNTSIVPAAAFTNISGLRITGRFVRVTYTNTGGGASETEFGIYIRST
jgi:hypothetical protein